MTAKKPTKPKDSDDFETVAKRLECEDDKEAFEKKLGKIAKAASASSKSKKAKR